MSAARLWPRRIDMTCRVSRAGLWLARVDGETGFYVGLALGEMCHGRGRKT